MKISAATIIASLLMLATNAYCAKEIAKGYNCPKNNKPDSIVSAFIQSGVVLPKEYNDTDSIKSFEVRSGFTAFGFPLVAVGGWDQDSRLFGRSPGTARPVHFVMIVQATSLQLKSALTKAGIRQSSGKANEPFPQIQVDAYNSAEAEPLPNTADQRFAYSRVTCTSHL